MGKVLSCRCEISHEGQELRLVADCRSCKEGKGDLEDGRCFSGIVEAWRSGFGADTIVLSGMVETQYSGGAVEIVKRFSELMADLDRLSKRSVPPEGGPKDLKKRCAGCDLSPIKGFEAMAKGLGSDESEFYKVFRDVAVRVSNAKFNDRTCASCLKATKDDLGFVLDRFEDLLRFVIKEGFSIVL